MAYSRANGSELLNLTRLAVRLIVFAGDAIAAGFFRLPGGMLSNRDLGVYTIAV